MSVTKTKPGEVEYVQPGTVYVRYGEEPNDVCILTGFTCPHDVEEGDKGTLTYHSYPGFGCWFFEKDK